jgi:hypothetical protein
MGFITLCGVFSIIAGSLRLLSGLQMKQIDKLNDEI